MFPDGEQWSVGLGAEYASFGFGLTYMKLNSDTSDLGEFDADNLLVGASYTYDAWSFGAVYGKILSAEGELADIDGQDSYELSAQYDLGGGASINGGVRRTYPLQEPDGDRRGRGLDRRLRHLDGVLSQTFCTGLRALSSAAWHSRR